MKEKIARGKPTFGAAIIFLAPHIVEIIGHAGFDWVLLNCEHSSIGPSDIELMAMAADTVGITETGRPKSNSSSYIQAVMDCGVKGVQVRISAAKPKRNGLSRRSNLGRKVPVA